MKKHISIFLIVIVALSFCGCDTSKNMIGTRFGAAYFNKPENTAEITCTYYSETQEDEIEIKIEDVTFCDELRKVIDGKVAGKEFCDCTGDYQVTIDNKYLLYLHTDKIVVYVDSEEYTGFTVKCSKEETKELYRIIEGAK